MGRGNDLKDRIGRERRTGAGHGPHPFSAELRRSTIAFIRTQRRAATTLAISPPNLARCRRT